MSILGLIGLGAVGILGVTGHVDAKETNEKAQDLASDARRMYNRSYERFESSKEGAENALVRFGKTKKEMYDNSFSEFITIFEEIRPIMLEVATYDSWDSKVIKPEEIKEVIKMNDIYADALASGVAGGATGVFISMAASGALPVVAGEIGFAGSMLALGEFGLAASTAGGALMAGVSATPLGVIAAPAVFFTGISASMKADENLDKAKTNYRKAEAAVSKMKTQIVKFDAITEKSNILNSGLRNSGLYLNKSNKLLKELIRLKKNSIGGRKFRKGDFTPRQLEAIKMSCALAKSTQSFLTVNVLDNNGCVSDEADNVNRKNSQSKISSTYRQIESKIK